MVVNQNTWVLNIANELTLLLQFLLSLPSFLLFANHTSELDMVTNVTLGFLCPSCGGTVSVVF